MQQLLLLSAMRPERITQCMLTFVSTVLHQVQTVQGQSQGQLQGAQPRLKRIISPMDFTKVAKTVRVDQIPVILFREESYLAVAKLQKFATRAGVSKAVVP